MFNIPIYPLDEACNFNHVLPYSYEKFGITKKDTEKFLETLPCYDEFLDQFTRQTLCLNPDLVHYVEAEEFAADVLQKCSGDFGILRNVKKEFLTFVNEWYKK